jgi:hypothetical protein
MNIETSVKCAHAKNVTSYLLTGLERADKFLRPIKCSQLIQPQDCT